MKLKLEDIILDRTKASAENKRLIQQIQGMLDLQTTVPEKAVLKVVAQEVESLRAFLESKAGAEAASAIVGGLCGKHPDGADGRWRETLAPGLRPLLGHAEAMYRDLETRVGYLMRPSTFEEVQALDPVKDCDRIYHSVSYEFRLEQKLFANLFEARPTVIPTGSLLFHSTGEFTLRSVQRINDTAMFFSNLLEWGLHSHRGRETISRLNGIHGRYAIASDTFKFILGNIMFVPEIWNAKLGWRPLSGVEHAGWYHAFARLGRAMNIKSIPDDREEMRQWWTDYGSRMADSTPVQRKTFDEIVIQVLTVYPKALRRFVLNALLSGMDDLYRNALGYPAPPEDVVAELREMFRIVGHYSSLLPRIPWIRSLQTYPLGGKVERLGVDERSVYMPSLDAQAPNGGYPQGLPPLGAEEGAERIFSQLPIISEEELARNAETNRAWVAIDGIVYDLTPFLFEHPGGMQILRPWLGKDATAAFAKAGHSPEARALMLNFRIGRLPSAQNRPIPALAPMREKRRPGWAPQVPVAREEWDRLLDGILGAVGEFEQGLGKPAVQDLGPVAPFPIRLPSHDRPQGTCPYPH
jgi:cytochrome b involved in lipid metabolism